MQFSLVKVFFFCFSQRDCYPNRSTHTHTHNIVTIFAKFSHIAIYIVPTHTQQFLRLNTLNSRNTMIQNETLAEQQKIHGKWILAWLAIVILADYCVLSMTHSFSNRQNGILCWHTTPLTKTL